MHPPAPLGAGHQETIVMSQPAYRLFNVELKRREQLSPALTRFVFGG
ncbi:TPA: siderophore-interacting protein, partial [Pseudomonas aeruginosa]